MLERLEGGASPRLGSFWSRRFARLLPAEVVTILLTLVSAAVLLPSSMWSGIWGQFWASLLYYENWQLAGASVEYYARYETLPSPLQHFGRLPSGAKCSCFDWPTLAAVAVILAGQATLPGR